MEGARELLFSDRAGLLQLYAKMAQNIIDRDGSKEAFYGRLPLLLIPASSQILLDEALDFALTNGLRCAFDGLHGCGGGPPLRGFHAHEQPGA